MGMILTEEQVMIQDSAREFCATQAATEQLRKLRDKKDIVGYEPKVWQEMCALGWSGVIVPEAFGGTGLGLQELGIILMEIGRTLMPSPLISNVLLGTKALLLGGSKRQQQQYLPDIVSGDHNMAFALDETPRYNPFEVALTAQQNGGNFKLNGKKILVMDGMTANTIIVVARTDGQNQAGLSLFLVPADCPGLKRVQLATSDSRAYANLELCDVEVDQDALLGELNQGASLLGSLLDYASTGIAAKLLGITEQAFEMTLEHLKERSQFGVLIGSFQALKHRMADMFCELQLARSTVLDALDKADGENPDAFALSASLCKAKTCEIARKITNEAVQMHGGIGVTDEHNIGLFLKRSRVLEYMFGNVDWHQNRYAQLQGY